MITGMLMFMGPFFPIALLADLIFPDSISEQIFNFFYNNADMFWDFVDKIFGIA
jgi:hypothetical protein